MTLRFRRFVSACVLLAVIGSSSPAYAWWNDDWQFRKELTLDLTASGANIAESPVGVPIVVRLSIANFGYFADTKPDGSDIRFVAADDKTPLKFHVERYDPQAQMAFLWVTVPRVTGGANSDKIYMYYGNSAAAAAADAGGSYDVNQALVYHFGAASSAAQDSTAYKTEPSAFTAEITPASLIGAGVKFSGSTSITIPASQVMRHVPSQGMTISAWIKFDVAQTRARIFSLEDTAGTIALGIDGTRAYVDAGPTGNTITVNQTGDGLTVGSWHHVALRVVNGSVTLLVDGVDVGTAATTVPELGGQLTVGASANNSNYFSGELDELQVSNIARPLEWLIAAARSQGMVAPLLVYGGDAQKEGADGGEGYFATTLRNVTVDGWVVIGILAVMFVWSVWIMIAKTIFLSKVQQGNAAFLAEFRKSRDDPAAIERKVGRGMAEGDDAAFEQGTASELGMALSGDASTYGASTLFRLYHHGMREVLTRIEGQTVSAERVRSLSPASIEAIRATLDASMTRMTQRLNSQMVLLTISIAGGPFLGLLGTVVGVLIVFAAIAATGDVNINAIAPGTAAALVATVAGLAVAIPCLFGYNWLNSKIKEITADMRVFVDEFVTRIAETYT